MGDFPVVRCFQESSAILGDAVADAACKLADYMALLLVRSESPGLPGLVGLTDRRISHELQRRSCISRGVHCSGLRLLLHRQETTHRRRMHTE
jgi:hypothetical protein